LLESGADVNAKNATDTTPLMAAVNLHPAEVISVLLENGADVNARHKDGTTILMMAASRASREANPNPEVIIMLVKNGADVNATTRGGLTPAFFAGGIPEIIEHLSPLTDADKTEIATDSILSNMRNLHGAAVFFHGRNRDIMAANNPPSDIGGLPVDDIHQLVSVMTNPEEAEWVKHYEFHIIGDVNAPIASRAWWISTNVPTPSVANRLQSRRESAGPFVGLFADAYAPDAIPSRPDYAGGDRVFMLFRRP